MYLSDNLTFYFNYISQIFKDKYNIYASYRLESKVVFYIENKSLNNFSERIKPYISSLQYNLKDSNNKLTMWSNLRLPRTKVLTS